jgi:hypothetical protein
MTSRFTEPLPQLLSLTNSITKRACKSGPRIAHFIGMDYEKMKALLETSREESTAQGKPEVKEFPKPDSRPDWKYLDHLGKDRIAA